MNKLFFILTCFIALSVLSGCGVKGNLYLPEEKAVESSK